MTTNYRPCACGNRMSWESKVCAACSFEARRNPAPEAEAERFWSKVLRGDDCWEWQAARRPEGYGKIAWRLNGRRSIEPAHRVAWRLTYGPIPAGLFVCHLCDNPPCVRPGHLFLASAEGNTRDMLNKNRGRSPGAQGERNANAKLTEADVRAIREARAQGETVTSLARQYGLSGASVSSLVLRKTWRKVA